jgi:hypothetical protein
MRVNIIAALLLVACSSPTEKKPTPKPASTETKKEPETKTAPSTTDTKPPETAPTSSASMTGATELITLDGIGPHKLGAKPKDKLEKDEYGFSYFKEGDLQLSYAEGKLCAISTDSSQYKTKEGLGVGNTFEEFEKAYGTTYVEAATGDIFFPEAYKKYKISVENMPAEGDKKPTGPSKVLSLSVDDCPRMPE